MCVIVYVCVHVSSSRENGWTDPSQMLHTDPPWPSLDLKNNCWRGGAWVGCGEGEGKRGEGRVGEERGVEWGGEVRRGGGEERGR